MANLLFHKVSDKERKDIERQAKQIMDSFSKKLDKIPTKLKEALIERDKGERAEGEGKGCGIDREIMFSNAPKKSGDFIVAERGGWK